MSSHDWIDPLPAELVQVQLRCPLQRNKDTARVHIVRFAPRTAVIPDLGSDDPEQWFVAARRLVGEGDPRGLQPLIELVCDTTALYYGEHFRAICNSEETRTEDALLVLLDDRHVGSAEINSNKTRVTNRPRIRQRLVQLLSDGRPSVRVAVAMSLLYIGSKEVATALVKHLKPSD